MTPITTPTPHEQHTFVDQTEYTWSVDQAAAATVMAWIKRTPDSFARDVAGMAEYFPHWLLVGSVDHKPHLCQRCQTFHVPAEGAMRCLKCRRPGEVTGLMWLGHIPVLARPEERFSRGQQALREAGFPEVTTGQTTYLLVPLTVHYPKEWPNVEPVVRYARRWLKILGLPGSSGSHHLIQNGRACIYSWGHWQATPIHTVLQQRMVNHIVSLFKIVAGQRPEKAFIGRIHNAAWQPAE